MKSKLTTTDRPAYSIVDLEDVAKMAWHGYQVTEKMDGRWHEIGIGSSRIVGELMPDGRFFAFDIPIFSGANIQQKPKSERMALLETFKLCRPAAPAAGETVDHFINRIMAAGGEGVVIANLESSWGCDVWKAKRIETFDPIVTERHPQKMSVRMALAGQDCGWCPILSLEKFNQISVGMFIEVHAMKRLVSGKFRDPRFMRIRFDKPSDPKTQNKK